MPESASLVRGTAKYFIHSNPEHIHKHQGSNWIRRDKRWAIYYRDGFLCVWCRGTGGGLTLDHLFPRGTRWYDNNHRRLVTACFECNRRRQRIRVSAWLRNYCRAGAAQRLLAARSATLNIQEAKKHREMLWAPLAIEGPLW